MADLFLGRNRSLAVSAFERFLATPDLAAGCVRRVFRTAAARGSQQTLPSVPRASRRPYVRARLPTAHGNNAAMPATRVRRNIRKGTSSGLRTFPAHFQPVFIDESPAK